MLHRITSRSISLTLFITFEYYAAKFHSQHIEFHVGRLWEFSIFDNIFDVRAWLRRYSITTPFVFSWETLSISVCWLFPSQHVVGARVTKSRLTNRLTRWWPLRRRRKPMASGNTALCFASVVLFGSLCSLLPWLLGPHTYKAYDESQRRRAFTCDWLFVR